MRSENSVINNLKKMKVTNLNVFFDCPNFFFSSFFKAIIEVLFEILQHLYVESKSAKTKIVSN